MSVVLSEHLPLLATAPDGVQKLRGLILDLAVRGKLVQQDPNDESASELLKRIAKERALLEAEGICKKSKVILPADGDAFYSLPENWQWSALDPLVRVMDSGWSPACIETPSPSDDVWGVLKTTAVQTFQYLAYENKELPANLVPRPECEVAAGDILITRAGPKNRVAISCHVEETRPHLMISDKIIRFHPVEGGMYEKFVALCLNAGATASYLENAKSGMAASQMNITQEKLRAAPIPICSTAEQHRIVAKVDELMALCDRLEAEQEDGTGAHARLVETLLGTLTQSTDAADLAANWQRLAAHFDSLFATEASIDTLKHTVLQLSVMGKLVPQDPKDEPASELLKRIAQERAQLEAEGVCKKSKAMPLLKEDVQAFSIPDTWQWTSLGGVSVTSTGKTPATSKAEYYGGALPFIGPGQLTPAGGILPPEKWLSDVGRTETTLAKAGDILMVCIGGSIGKAAIAKSEIAFNQQINCARPILISSEYLYSGMTAQYFQKAVLAKATGSATPIINRSNWDEIALPIPPLGEQHRIVAKVDELMALCDHLKADLVTARQKQATLADTLIESALEAA